ncbi:hypothetical protein P261_01951 [Lachnospiraceae bacterium TWA4]|nr:hypothetical protein P261_01951 [Lachnospiraceae bacterium TWA4]
MARPTRCRRICRQPDYDGFHPNGISSQEMITLTLDEYETIRLIDLEKLTHVQCAEQMCISKTTVTEIYESAREKVADSIVNGKALEIAGGNYRFCDGMETCRFRSSCQKQVGEISSPAIEAKGENTMRIAVTYENGEIFQHFGHTEAFKVYDVEDGKIVNEQVIGTNGQGHGALAGFLSQGQIDVLICGGIGGGAQNALANAGIKLYGGVCGSADEAVKAFLAGKLEYNPNEMCNHHGHGEGHNCGEHTCH